MSVDGMLMSVYIALMSVYRFLKASGSPLKPAVITQKPSQFVLKEPVKNFV